MRSPEDPSQRIVITGRGLVTPMGPDGHEVATAMDAIFAGEHGIKQLPEEINRDYPQLGVSTAAIVENFDITRDPLLGFSNRERGRLHRCMEYALWGTAKALREAGLVGDEHPQVGNNGAADPTRVGVSIGTGIGGADRLIGHQAVLNTGKSVKPYDVLPVLPERVATTVSMRFGLQGPVREVSAACATGPMNIITGADILKVGRADVVVAGGTEAQINAVCLGLFDAPRTLDRAEDPELASRPFHRAEAGFTMGEGAGIVVLETLEHAQRRGATVLAELVGYDDTGDAYHDTLLSGEGAKRALQNALGQFALGDNSVIYVNAHATGTGGDKLELGAIAEAIDRDRVVGVSSTKGAHGHMLGATGAVETIISIEALQRHELPPNLKLNDDPENMVDIAREWPLVPSQAAAAPAGSDLYVVKNSFGFGGVNTALVLRSI